MAKKRSRQRGTSALKRGLVTSFFLGSLGFLGAFLAVLVWGGETVYLSSFLNWWFAFSCLGGGIVAGFWGGAKFWLKAYQIGLSFGGIVLFLFFSLVPESLGVAEIFTYLGIAVFLSGTGALGGANWQIRQKSRATRCSSSL